MTAGRFGLLEIRERTRAAMAALRPTEPVVFQEYRPLPPADVRLTPQGPLHTPPEAGASGSLWGALGVSVAAHGGVLAYVLTHQLLVATPDGGHMQQASAPISVELVDTRVFQALMDGKQTEAAPAPSAPAATASAPTPPEPATTAALPEEKREMAREAPPEPQQVAAEAPLPQPEKIAAAAPQEAPAAEPVTPPVLAVPSAEASETIAPASPEANITATTPPHTEPQQPSRTEIKVKQNASAKAEHRKRQQHASLGSKASAGESGAETSAARASASRGSVLSYRSRVQAHLAANRPSGGHGPGTVRISFIVSPVGRLISAHISRSSGKPTLDQKALSAVRTASPYPAPPMGLNAAQRSFTMPFYFE